jgi:tRNA nucleotidyltransferase/poly(A) polymerase
MNSIPLPRLEQRVQPLFEHPFGLALRQVAQGLSARPYLVGGAVRDLIRWPHALPKDLDFLILNCSAGEVARQFSQAVGGRYVLLDEQFGIHRVIVRDEAEEATVFDFSDALENDLQKDLGRRDLTLNAMAIGLLDYHWVDPFEGQADLENSVVRMVSQENLVEDPLRMLRVYRIAAKLGKARLDPETVSAVRRNKSLINTVAAERVQYELLSLLSITPCFDALKAMGEVGLLEEVLPELRATRDIPPNGHHHLWLYDHTLELVLQAETLIGEFPPASRQWIESTFNAVVTRLGLVKLACLLHDIGKPATMAHVEGGRATYYGHDAVSEEMAEVICKRWKVSGEVGALVKKLVRWHLYPCQFGPDSPRKSLLRFFRRIGEDTPDLLLLALADRFSTRGGEITPEVLETSRRHHLWLAEQYEAEQTNLRLPPLLNGHEVMSLLNIPPGPKIKEVLNALQEVQQLGEVTTPEAARPWVLEHFNPPT